MLADIISDGCGINMPLTDGCNCVGMRRVACTSNIVGIGRSCILAVGPIRNNCAVRSTRSHCLCVGNSCGAFGMNTALPRPVASTCI